jgi:two-component system sensor histidine kinase PilS (NtrC family)
VAEAAPQAVTDGAAPAASAEADLRRRVIRLMAVRTLVVSVVFGTSAWLILRANAPRHGATYTLLSLIGATYLLTLLYALLLRRGVAPSRLVWPQLAGDLAITTLLVFVTGAAQSAYTFFFALSIVAAGALRYRRGVVIVGALSLALMVAVSALGRLKGLLPVVPWARPWDQSSTEFTRALAQNAVAIVAVAVLAYILGEQLQRTTLSLATERRAVADLVSLNQDIVRSLSSGLVTVNEHGQVQSANAAALEILERTGDAAGQPIDALLPGLGDRIASLRAGESLRRVDLVITRGGREQVLGITVSPLRDDRGAALGSVVNFQDLTDLRQLERSMRHAERMATLGQLTAGIAHEIRNPLASISGSVELLAMTPRVSDDDRALMAIVTREIDRLNTLITEMLDYASPRPLQAVPLDLRALVEETLRVFRQDPTVTGAEVVGPGDAAVEPVHVTADPEKVRQVLWNLLRNAVDATEDRPRREVRVELRAAPTSVALSIHDTGAGISVEQQARIFDPFFTTKRRGTGLGLPICQSIVAEHGGAIAVTSEVGVGTTFTITLPR